MLLSQPRVDLGVTAIKRYPAFPTTPASPSDCLVSYSGPSLRGVIPLCRDEFDLFYSPSGLGQKTILFKTVQFNMHKVFVYTQLTVKTFLFQTVQFSIKTIINSI